MEPHCFARRAVHVDALSPPVVSFFCDIHNIARDSWSRSHRRLRDGGG